MKQKLRVVLVGLLVSLMSQVTFAQYVTGNQLVADTEWTKSLHDGQRMTNVGKTIMLTGASIAMTGLTAGVVAEMYGGGSDISAFAFYTAIGGYIGGMVALTGLPVYLVGKHKMKKHGSSLMTISSEGQNGYVTNVELGWGLSSCISLDVVRGYNFNEHLFVGGGVGCSTYLFAGSDEDFLDYSEVPVFADLRLTGGSKRVTPYMGARLGCTLTGFELYSSFEFGTNIRSASGSQCEAWWMGIKTEFVVDDVQFIGLSVGKSF